MSDLGVLTENEKRVIEAMRSLRPYETVQVMADENGRPNVFVVTRTSKVLLEGNKLPVSVRVRLRENY